MTDELGNVDEALLRRPSGDGRLDDVPEDLRSLRRVLTSLASVAAEDPFARERETVEAMKAVLSGTHPTVMSHRRFRMSKIRIVAASTAAMLSLTTGLAFAGALPGAAQDVAKEMLGTVGITVPGADARAGTHPDGRGSGDHGPATTDAGKGEEISSVARTTDAEGVRKGAEVSDAASEGRSRAGDPTAPAAPRSRQSSPRIQTDARDSASVAPVPAPNSGGADTGDQASDGRSTEGTGRASGESGGRSDAGAGNQP